MSISYEPLIATAHPRDTKTDSACPDPSDTASSPKPGAASKSANAATPQSGKALRLRDRSCGSPVLIL
jgi:hypothetical protein